ncbi:MAG: hypothetical protein AAFX50_11085 [Acidobacteriota bacterium]
MTQAARVARSASPYSQLARRGLRTVEVEPGVVAVMAGGVEIVRLRRRGLPRFVEFELSNLPAVERAAAPEADGDLPLGTLMSTRDMV